MSKAAMIVIALVIVLFFLLTSLWGFYVTVRPPKLHSKITPQDLGVEFEAISFETDDNISLSGWFIPTTTENAKTIILLHGYPADKGNILPSLLFLNEQYNLLLFDFRYLGESEGSYSTIGAKETKDLQAAISYLNTRGINQVGIWGFSMGGAVALMAAPSPFPITTCLPNKPAPEAWRLRQFCRAAW